MGGPCFNLMIRGRHSHIGIDLICIVRLAIDLLKATKGRDDLRMFMRCKMDMDVSLIYSESCCGELL